MKKFLMIAAMAMFATVACKSDDPQPEPPIVGGAPDATIVAAPASVAVTKAGAFTATLSKAAEADVTITVTNANADFLTVAAAEIKIAKGATTGTVAFTGKAVGAAKVTFASKDATVKTAELTVTVTEAQAEYCTISFPEGFGAYASLGSFTLGTTKIEAGEGHMTYEGTAKLADNFTVNFQPFSGENATGAGDKYGIMIYADWNKDGKFDGANEKIFEKEVTATAAAEDFSGTITIPADAAASSRIRVVSLFLDKDGFSESDLKDGCGHVESGTVIDVTYTK